MASDGQGGVFYGLRTLEGYFIAHQNADGDELASELLTYEETPSGFVRLAPDGQGGVVLAVAVGEQDPNTGGEVSNDNAILVRLDSSLQQLWEVQGFGPGRSRGVALAEDGTGGLIAVGLRSGSEPPTVFGMFGQTWVARVNL